jgi:hypothetical protein
MKTIKTIKKIFQNDASAMLLLLPLVTMIIPACCMVYIMVNYQNFDMNGVLMSSIFFGLGAFLIALSIKEFKEDNKK